MATQTCLNQLVSMRESSASFFSVMSTALLQGRFFRDADTLDQEHSVMINKAFADTYFAGLNPVGRRISLHAPHPSWYTVVGVVANQRSELEDGAIPTAYQPIVGERTAYLVIRSQLPPQAITSMVGAPMQTLEPDLVTSDFNTMAEILSGATAQRRFQTTLLAAFAAITLLQRAPAVHVPIQSSYQ